MFNTKSVFLCTFLFFVFPLFSQQIGKYPIHNFSPKTYHSGNQNNGFAQNENTRLFVANNLGVLSYNGTSWENHPILIGSKIRSLAFHQKENRLYVGAQGDLGYFTDDWQYTSLSELVPESVNFDEVWNVYIIDDRIYFCTFQAIFVYHNNTIEIIDGADGFYHSFLVNNELYVQSNRGDLLQVNQSNQLKKILAVSDGRISSVLPYEDGLLIIYNSGFIEWYNRGERRKVLAKLSDRIKNKYVNHAVRVINNRIAVATQLDGVYLFDIENNSIEHIAKSDGLLSNVCLQLFEDFQGNLWVGMQNGIGLIDINSPMRTLGEELEIEGSGYQSLETENEIYLSTSNGIYRYDKQSEKTELLSGTEGPAYELAEIYGNIYAGHHQGLFQLKGNKAEQLFSATGIWNLQLLNDGVAAIAGSYNGLYVFEPDENNVLSTVKKVNGFDESSRFVVEDDQNNFWVSQYYKGVYRIELSEDLTATVEQITTEHGLPTNSNNSVFEVNGQIHFATPHGIYVFDASEKNIIQSPLFYNDIGNSQVDLLKEDRSGNLLVITGSEIGMFRKNGPDNYAYYPSSLMALEYSINNDLLEASNGLNNGILISANEGFIFYEPEMEQTEVNQPPVQLKTIRSIRKDSILYSHQPFESKVLTEQEFVLPYQSNSLRFQVEGFDYFSEGYFRYRLEGLDNEFTEWTTSEMKEYTNIPEGNYTFIAESKNSLGEVRSSAPVFIRIQPPWYRSTFARIIYALVAVSILYMVYLWQKSKFKTRAEEIVAVKQQEIKQGQEKLREIEKRSAEEIDQLKEEKMESELRHLNNLLAASTMNLVVKNEFIETIQEELKSIKGKNGSSTTKRSLDRIVKEIDSNLRLQEDWERFEHHFDQVHGDFLDRLRDEFPDLTPQDQKLCAYLRLNLNTKEIAQLMSISVRGVEMARYRLRKRMEMETEQNLSKFILEY